ncbi:uncharacterized protein LOC120160180 [Hibiscus syriacus]|uniref:uncharacterized protein LOC120160180 n=1 Tax=Hibiscus syriacus TaxID=106335 RepID=UPI00192405B8|nr:uncharacterized protein LOC120160180 [Hibiscus syriacus]
MAAEAQFCYENLGLPLPILPSFEPGFSLQEFPCQQNAQSLASMTVSQPLDIHLEIQRQELDCFLQLRNERLRYALQEQRNQQVGNLLKTVESKALYLLTRKEEDLARATKKRIELEACLREVEMGSESWKRLAEANESMVLSKDWNKLKTEVQLKTKSPATKINKKEVTIRWLVNTATLGAHAFFFYLAGTFAPANHANHCLFLVPSVNL